MKTKRLIDNFLTGVEWRKTVRNWPEDVKTIVDGYRSYTSIGHAVQKDAIQNGWSARRNKKGNGWEFEFKLIEGKSDEFLMMTDKGTTGLTGRVLKPEEYEMDLPPNEKWGRFEGVAFTQDRSEKTLGSRGRGKFIFVGASADMTILYDSVREDGSYRFGLRTVEKTESPIAAYDDEDGKRKLSKITNGIIKPLDEVGSRVIIVNPVEDLINEIKHGNFDWFISETWWEIILKYGATIKLTVEQDSRIIGMPSEFELTDKEKGQMKIWIKKNHTIPVSGEDFKIKTLHIAHNEESELPEEMQGISIQRGGMKICVIRPPSFLTREIGSHIYGYINFEASAEEELLEDEGIEHYSYDYRKPFPKAIKRFVEDELQRFAKEKLGYGIDAREARRRQQEAAERRALNAANNFAKNLGIGTGPGVKTKRKGGRGSTKLVRIQMDELAFPRPGDIRVNYGEKCSNIKIRIVNDDSESVQMRARLFLRFYDREVRVYYNNDLVIDPKSATPDIGPFEELMHQENFPDVGRYTVTAKIISLSDKNKGLELDYKTKSFYLEQDPPMRGLFERCEPVKFPDKEPQKFMMGDSEYGDAKGLILNYNVNHPGYNASSEDEEDLVEYILRIAGQELCRFDLIQEKSMLFRAAIKVNPEEVLQHERMVLGELVFKFRSGEL
jgi:hypothetical protein